MTVYFVCQVDRQDSILGIRSVYLYEKEGLDDIERANCQITKTEEELKTGWPIWKVIPREVEI